MKRSVKKSRQMWHRRYLMKKWRHCIVSLEKKGILCYEPWFGGYFWTEQRLIDAQKAYLNVQKAFDEYRRKVEERS